MNSAEPPEGLNTSIQLQGFLSSHNYTGSFCGTPAELNEVRASRALLRSLLTERDQALAKLINGILKEAAAVPQLVRHGPFDWHIHGVSGDAPVATRIQVETALAMSEMLRTDQLNRLAVCEADTCEKLLLDLTKGRSRRFCSVTCGNRISVSAYRERRRSAAKTVEPMSQ